MTDKDKRLLEAILANDVLMEEGDITEENKYFYPNDSVCRLPSPKALEGFTTVYNEANPDDNVAGPEALSAWLNAWIFKHGIAPVGMANFKSGMRMVFDIEGKNYTLQLHKNVLLKRYVSQQQEIIPLPTPEPEHPEESYDIVDTMDVTPYESPVLILADGRVIYQSHDSENGICKEPDNDRVWAAGRVSDWKTIFEDMDDEETAQIKSFADDWDGEVNAANIHTYIAYFGISFTEDEPGWTWAEYEKDTKEYKAAKNKENTNSSQKPK
jgi:hypothetical protein